VIDDKAREENEKAFLYLFREHHNFLALTFKKNPIMKLVIASLFLAAPAMAFAPSASFGVNSALKMSTETETEKVRSHVSNSRNSKILTYK
jgi:hypothetical protein